MTAAASDPDPARSAALADDDGGTSIEASLHVHDAVVDLGGHRVLDHVALTLQQGELGCLLGPSGCGKTTLLRSIAGLQDLAAGRIDIAGRTVSDGRSTLPPDRRGIGLVFQDLALFPHLDVIGNIGFGLRRLDRAQRDRRLDDLVDRLHLRGLEQRYPHELSGGQQQRVAIARALAPQPALLLLDEPFSSLDASLRKQLRVELRALLKQLGHTALLVTHDQEEAMGFSDRVAVMRDGRIEQFDTPWQLYHRPVNRYVAGFVGEGALLAVHRDNDDWRCALGVIPSADIAGDSRNGIVILVRPDDLLPDDRSPLRARIDAVEFRGADEYVALTLRSGERVFALWPSHVRAKAGTDTGLRWQSPHTVTFTA